MKISFEAIGQQYVTFLAGANVREGMVCKAVGGGAVDVCGAGQRFCGVVTEVRSGAAAVLMHGYCELGYTGAAPVPGFCKLAGDGAGGVSVSDAGGEFLVVNVDAVNKTVGLFL